MILRQCFNIVKCNLLVTPTCPHLQVNRLHVEVAEFVRDFMNRSMKMNVPMMGPNALFRHLKNRFLSFLSHAL
jgi:hypothetical protein